MPKDKNDKVTKDLCENWPRRKEEPPEKMFSEWLKISPRKRDPFWEWCHKKRIGKSN